MALAQTEARSEAARPERVKACPVVKRERQDKVRQRRGLKAAVAARLRPIWKVQYNRGSGGPGKREVRGRVMLLPGGLGLRARGAQPGGQGQGRWRER